MANELSIRQAKNEVKVEGILKEVNLEYGKNKDGNRVISGSVVILVGKNSEVKVNTYVAEWTKERKISRAFSGLETVMREYVSIASLMKNAVDEHGHEIPNSGKSFDEAATMATRVQTAKSAYMNLSEYYTEGGELVSEVRYNSSFFSRVDNDVFNPSATFAVEVYINRIRKESKNGEETGKIFVDAIVPMYGGTVAPITFEAEDEVAEYLDENYPPRSTGFIWGNIISTVNRVKNEQKGFGASRVEEIVTREKALRITGGNSEPYDEDSPKVFSTDAIQNAMKIRETEYLPALLQKRKEKGKASERAPGFRTNSGAPAVANDATPKFTW